MKAWPQGLSSILASFAHPTHSGAVAAPVGMAGTGGGATDVGAVEDELLVLVLALLADGDVRGGS